MSILHRHHTEPRPSVFPSQSNPEVAPGSGNGGPEDPKDFNNYRDSDPRKRRGLFIAIGSAAAGAAATAALVFGLKNNSAPNTPPSSETTTSAPATTAPSNEVSPTPTQTTTEVSPTPTETTPSFNEALIAGMEGMKTPAELAEFHEMPLSAQQAYALSKYYEIAEDALLNKALSPVFHDNGKSLSQYNPFSNPLERPGDEPSGKQLTLLTDDGNDIMRQNLFMRQVTGAWEEDPHAGNGNTAYDKVTAEKLVGGEALPGTEWYESRVGTVQNHTSPKVTGLDSEQISGYVVESTSNLYKAEYSGKEYDARKLTVRVGGNTYETVFVFTARPDLLGYTDGQPNGLWVQAEQSDPSKAK